MPWRLPQDMVDAVEFNGVIFRRYPYAKKISHQRYYSPGGTDRARGIESLHREVWKHHHGHIPPGYVVHHKDDNPLNNDIENLECLAPNDHKLVHAWEGKWSSSPRVRQHLRGIARLAADWHASHEGRQWHSSQARESYGKRQPAEFTCGECGTRFQSKHRASLRADGMRFCSERCTGASRRKEGRQLKTLSCFQCGAEYMGDGRGVTCSKRCAANLRWTQTGRRRG